MSIKRKILRWIRLLLSDSSQASIRRFIGFQSFYLFLAILIYATLSTSKLANNQLIQQGIDYLFYIVMVTIVGVTATDVVRMYKARRVSVDNSYINNSDEELDNQAKQDIYKSEQVNSANGDNSEQSN